MNALKSSAFATVDRPDPLHLTVAARILEEITSGRLAPGDRLPTEHELASAFNVSRNIIREAIACLRADGVIESRQGLGAFVLDPRERQALRIQTSALANQRKLTSLFELRGVLEIEAAALAAQRRTKAQLQSIAQALRRMEEDQTLSDAGVDADLDFHHHIAAAAGNDYLVEFLDFVAQRVRQTIVAARASNKREALFEATINEHQAIYDAIASADADAARQAMRRHIDGAARRLKL